MGNENIKTKVCTKCNLEYPMTDEYFYYKNKQKKEMGFLSWCKKCVIKKNSEYEKKNLEKYTQREREKRKRNPEYSRSVARKYRKRNLNRVKRDQKTWRQNNRDKLKIYNAQHRNHAITELEWETCKTYFNYSCAYCGMAEEEHKEKYKQQLHKDHVDHQGSNGIDNCVPSCKSCNSKKHTRDLIDWYSESNSDINFYDQGRLEKIIIWIKNKGIIGGEIK